MPRPPRTSQPKRNKMQGLDQETKLWLAAVLRDPRFNMARSAILTGFAVPKTNVLKAMPPDIMAALALDHAHCAGIARAFELLDQMVREKPKPEPPPPEWKA